MLTLDELHNAYMKSRDDFDNYDVDNDYEAQKINEYCKSDDEIVELVHWKPVAKNNIVKIKELER